MKKTILAAITLCVSFAIISGIAAYYFSFSLYYSEMEDSLRRHVNMIANESKESQLLFIKKLIAQRFLTAAYDENEERFIGPPIYETVSIRTELKDDRPLRSRRIVYLRASSVPRFVLLYSLDDYFRTDVYLRFLIPFYVVILMITAVLFYIAYIVFIRPVTAITRSTQLISQGQYDVQVKEEGVAEIRTLARHFNYMSGTVQNTMQVLNYVIDNLGVGFVVLRQDGTIVHANKMAEIVYGGVLSDNDALKIFPFLSPMLTDNNYHDGVFFTQTFTAMDGSPVFADFVITRMNTGKAPSIVLVVQKRESVDVASCEVQSNALKTLSSVIAHEIKNPLNVIAMIVTTLKKKYQEDTKWHDIENQLQSINSIASQIGSLIEFSPTSIQLQEFTEALLEQWRSVFEGGTLEFIADYTTSPVIHFDIFKLKIICDNIIKNAIEECDKQLHLTVTLRVFEHYVFMEFADNGKGFDAESLVRLTQLGYTTKEHGSGIGIYIIRLLLAMGNATMELTSDVGKKTTISMRFTRYENTAD